MTTRTRTRKAAPVAVDIDLDLDSTDVIVDPIIDFDGDPIIADQVDNDDAPAAPNRKYMSHAGHDHATKGDAGKAARATCRRAHRAWFAAEAAYIATLEVTIAS